MPNLREVYTGAIPGLRLPPHVWSVLRKEGIMTLGQLRSVADRIEHVVPGIGPTMAQVIRAELARVAASQQSASQGRVT